MMSAYPPLRTQQGIPVSPETALKFLSTYLSFAKSNAYLLPNARLESTGPTAGSSSSSITIHNLQRVEAGLRGEWLAPKLDLEEGDMEIVKGMDDGTAKEIEKEEGWMDLEDYQREQSVEGPEQAEEEIGVEDGEDVEEGGQAVHAEDEVEEQPETPKIKMSKRKRQEVEENTTKAPLDATARKRKKKERQKAEKKAREEQRKKESQTPLEQNKTKT